jgi:uncharacterized membrane protein (UPF0136 family)
MKQPSKQARVFWLLSVAGYLVAGYLQHNIAVDLVGLAGGAVLGVFLILKARRRGTRHGSEGEG